MPQDFNLGADALPKQYSPKDAESRIYQMWLDGGYFHARVNPDKKPFCIVIPPPNVTGQLHLGHAFDETLQDVLTRFKRMQGFEALWLPGTDHAGIATQAKVEEQLRSEGTSRHELGREKFLERVWAWKEKYGSKIVEQIKKLGASCDWERERFTMDEGCSHAVREVFVNLYEKGLIYKGSRIINLCPKCATALSDAEVDHIEEDGHFWHLRYPVYGSGGVSSDNATDYANAPGAEFVTVATTRPETMLGDSAVAVNPEDERYTHLVGKTLVLPLTNRKIPVIADEYVDREFGTGCVKITPAHDPNDFEVGKRHSLPEILILTPTAVVTGGTRYDGLPRFDARKQILADLEAQGLLIKTEEHRHAVGHCSRCNETVEPMVSEQWFVKMEPLAAKSLDCVDNGGIKFVPERFVKTFDNWMNSARDWCISRQLWWGHRIPAWYCEKCGKITVSREDPTECSHCGSHEIKQDEDVLDTWFSSALWPFSTLGWPEKTPELEYFYPTSVLVTGYDILFFWVARMIFSGLEQMGERPFETVLFHGLIRDEQGRKMSKSLGNGVDPLEVIDEYGADALRFNIITGNSPGNDMRYFPARCEAMRNFANKIWNASRFVLLNLTVSDVTLPPESELRAEDKWILTKLHDTIAEVLTNFDVLELGIAANSLYDFIWTGFCDWYIELVKPRLMSEDAAEKQSCERVLLYVLTHLLKALHPFMPFITEYVWQQLPAVDGVIMTQEYPEADKIPRFPEDARRFDAVRDAISAIRTRRAEMNVPQKMQPSLLIETNSPEDFTAGIAQIKKLAGISEITVSSTAPSETAGYAVIATAAAKLYLPLAELVDLAEERARLSREIAAAEKNLAGVEGKLSNEQFMSKAPDSVVQKERDRLAELTTLIENLKSALSRT